MKNISKNQQGFSLIEVWLAVLIVVLIGLVGYLVYKNHQTTKAANTSANSTASNWIRYTNTSPSFSVYFPSKPLVIPTTNQFYGNSPKVTMVQVTTATSQYTSQYRVTYFIYKSGVTPPSGASGLSTAFIQNNFFDNPSIISSKYSITNSKQVETFEVTGTDNNKKGEIKGEVLRDGQDIYLITAMRAGNTIAPAPNTQYFIDNFMVN